jgi:hypothetical protein
VTRADRATRARIAVGAAASGVVLLVVGTFLPWLESGSVSRTSYQAAGALRSLVHTDGPARLVLHAWPFVSAAAAVAVALLVLGQRLFGAIVTALAGLAAGTVAIATLAAPANGLIRPATVGPLVTLLGSAVAIIGATATLILSTRTPGGSVDRTAGPESRR